MTIALLPHDYVIRYVLTSRCTHVLNEVPTEPRCFLFSFFFTVDSFAHKPPCYQSKYEFTTTYIVMTLIPSVRQTNVTRSAASHSSLTSFQSVFGYCQLNVTIPADVWHQRSTRN